MLCHSPVDCRTNLAVLPSGLLWWSFIGDMDTRVVWWSQERTVLSPVSGRTFFEVIHVFKSSVFLPRSPSVAGHESFAKPEQFIPTKGTSLGCRCGARKNVPRLKETESDEQVGPVPPPALAKLPGSRQDGCITPLGCVPRIPSNEEGPRRRRKAFAKRSPRYLANRILHLSACTLPLTRCYCMTCQPSVVGITTRVR